MDGEIISKISNIHCPAKHKPQSVLRQFLQIIQKYVVPQAKQFMQINGMEEFEKAGNKMEYTLMPLTDIHLRSDKKENSMPTAAFNMLCFSSGSHFILLIACINFMNLSTARSANR